MNKVNVVEHGTDLSSRATGRAVRELVESLASNGPVEIDFSAVRSVSHSFADELLAVLIEDRGESWFAEKIRVSNHAPAIRYTLLDAINHRLTRKRRAA